MGPILVAAELQEGKLNDASRELLSKARELAGSLGTSVVAVAFGPQAKDALKEADADQAVAVGGDAVAGYSPAAYEEGMTTVMDKIQPGLVLLSNTTMGMDLGASLAARWGQPMVAYCNGLEAEGDHVVAKSQVYGGKLVAEVELALTGAVITVIPGSWPSTAGTGSPTVTEVTVESAPGVELVKVIAPESGGDVDITKADILVSVGRGIQDPDNLELANELAEAIGGVVSCSRPVVDAGWLPRSRQVGKSGQTVKPKLYLAFGISGAPEHLQGMKDAELIVAVNNDASAPIFEVAHYGATVDILDLMPALTERLQGGA